MRTRVALPLLLGAGLLALGWWFLAPPALGGHTSYVVTHGVSMQPRFHAGDLAIVRSTSTYRAGDIAAYRSDLLDTTVLHRIVKTTADGYVLKGDNNAWVDPERPGPTQMVGRLALRVPHGGVALGWIRQPAVAGLLAVAILIPGAAGAAELRRRRRRRIRAERATMTLHHLDVRAPLRHVRSGAALAIAALLGAGVAATYVLPADSTTARSVTWSTKVAYEYDADTAPNLVYPDGRVHSGQTVFRNLVDRLTVRATWSAHAPVEHQIRGTAALRAIVHGPEGWTHEIDLGAPSDFAGDRKTLTGTIDLAALDAAVNRAAELTGVRADRYTVSLQPLVTLAGDISGTPLSQASAVNEPALTLTVTPRTVTVAGATASDAGGDTASAAGSLDPQPTTRSAQVDERGGASWHLLGRDLPIAAVRVVGTAGAGLALLLAAVLLLAERREKDPCALEARRLRASIIPVSGHRIAATSSVLEVASLRALAQVARRYDRLILHVATTPGVYLVEDETGLYRYQCTHRRDTGARRRHLAARPEPADGPVVESA